MKTKADKKSLLKNLLCNLVDQIDVMPHGIKMLVKQMAKHIPEDTIDETISGVLDFLADAYTQLEEIAQDDEGCTLTSDEIEMGRKQLQA